MVQQNKIETNWSYLCEHQCVTKLLERSTEWCVSPSLRRQTYPQQSLTIVVPRWIQALMMVSNVSAERSATGSRQVSPIPARQQQTPMLSRATCCNYTFAWWSSSDLFPQLCHHPPPPANQYKKSCKKQLKMKFDIALRQKCDQPATVWWSTESSARHWGVEEWRLTLNKSGDDSRETT